MSMSAGFAGATGGAWTPASLFTGGVTGEWWEIPPSGFSGLS